MKKIVFLAVLVLAVSAVPAKATTCVPDSLANYILAGSCTLDGLTFSAFSYIPTNAPPASSITITPTLAGLIFAFNSSWVASANQIVDSTIAFTITAASAIIKDLDLTLVAASCSGTGTVTLTENAVSGGTGVATLGGILCSGGVPDLTTHIATFAPVSSLTVTKDLGLNGNSGSASVSQFNNSVSLVPEPGTLALFGSGLLGIAGLIRRKLTS